MWILICILRQSESVNDFSPLKQLLYTSSPPLIVWLCGFTGKSEPIREVAAWPLTSPGDLFSRYGLARNSKQLHLLWNVQILIAVLHSWGQTVKQQQLISNNKINIYLSTIANNNTTAYNYLFMAYFSAFRLFTIGGFFFSVFLIFFDF